MPAALTKVAVRTTSSPAAPVPILGFGPRKGSIPVHLELFALQNVQPKAGTPGVAQESGGGGAAPAAAPGGGMMMILPLLIMVPFLFLTFRRQKKEQQQREKLKKGDRVASTSGLIGELMELDERFAKVKIAPGTTVQMLASSIAPLEDKATTAAKDLKDAKVADEKK
jgi:preprotein translocase subunit YajC